MDTTEQHRGKRWPVLHVSVPHDFYAMVLQDAKAAGRKVSELCRERLMAGWALEWTPTPRTQAPADHARAILKDGEMEALAFVQALTAALLIEMGKGWPILEDLIAQGVLKEEIREGVRYVSLLS